MAYHWYYFEALVQDLESLTMHAPESSIAQNLLSSCRDIGRQVRERGAFTPELQSRAERISKRANSLKLVFELANKRYNESQEQCPHSMTVQCDEDDMVFEEDDLHCC
jgi:hypothetical protein